MFELYFLQRKKSTENNKLKEDYTNDEIKYQDSLSLGYPQNTIFTQNTSSISDHNGDHYHHNEVDHNDHNCHHVKGEKARLHLLQKVFEV
jgi:hypothetical protein